MEEYSLLRFMYLCQSIYGLVDWHRLRRGNGQPEVPEQTLGDD